MTGAGELPARHGDELRRRVAELSSALDEDGAGSRGQGLAHTLKGSALALGLDVLAVACDAAEAACAAGDLAGARRAVLVAGAATEALGSETPQTHELRSALALISGYAGLLQAAALPDEHAHAVEEILGACERIAAALEPPDEIDLGLPPAAGSRALTARVLVVDDDLLVGGMLRDLLARAGCRVTHVVSAADALEAIAAERPDLVLLDLELGQEDGSTVLRDLRANPSLAGLPVVISSGHQEPELEAELRALGADWVLSKPIDIARLRAIIEGLDASTRIRGASHPG